MADTLAIRLKAQTLRDLESLAPAWNLEQLLEAICHYGRPRLSLLVGGWVCVVEMHVASEGASFEIKSEFNHATPGDAARMCASRIVAALRSYVHDTTI
jgi:hypothetical protein